MTSSDRHSETRTVELPAEQMDIVCEMMIRGFAETPPAEREYAEAYDAFLDEAGYPNLIGDHPNRVRDALMEVLEEASTDARR